MKDLSGETGSNHLASVPQKAHSCMKIEAASIYEDFNGKAGSNHLASR
jgi:hypothetical protein